MVPAHCSDYSRIDFLKYTIINKKNFENRFEAIFYCASFYFICVLLEDKKILSRVFDVDENMGVIRESKNSAGRN